MIEFSAAEKIFVSRGKEVRALQPTNLEIARGEFVSFVGPSGCGKSTALNLIAGLFQPTNGRVRYNGNDLIGLNRRIGYMTQKDTLLPWRTVAGNIGISLELNCRDVSRKDAADKIQKFVELVGLKGFEHHFPNELSGGMRKRVALARSLIYEPETLLLDEPFGALDAQLKLIMMEQLQKLIENRDMTVVFVTHDLGEAITLSHRVVVFSARPGRIRAIREIDLPRPRDIFKLRFERHFSTIYEELWDELKEEVIKGTDV